MAVLPAIRTDNVLIALALALAFLVALATTLLVALTITFLPLLISALVLVVGELESIEHLRDHVDIHIVG